jgi:hypothetical protein
MGCRLAPTEKELILLNRLCWLDRFPSRDLDSATCAHLQLMGLLERTPGGQWVPTPSGRSVAASCVADGYRDWIPKN